MRMRWVGPSLAMAAASMVAVLGTVGVAQQNPAQPNFDNVEVKTWPVQGNVYLAVGGFVNAAFSVGDDGVIVVDTMVEPLADKFIAEIRKVAGNKPIRYIINTHVHADHTGGNIKVAAAGQSVVGGNFAAQVGQAAAESAFIWAHENVLSRMSTPREGQPAIPFAAWPTDTFFTPEKELYFNGEAVQVLHQPASHTDGDSIVFFRKSDVVVAGDVFVTTTFHIINLAQGGGFNGLIDARNRIIDLRARDSRRRHVRLPGHGRITDEADVLDTAMVTIIRDRFQTRSRGMTLEM